MNPSNFNSQGSGYNNYTNQNSQNNAQDPNRPGFNPYAAAGQPQSSSLFGPAAAGSQANPLFGQPPAANATSSAYGAAPTDSQAFSFGQPQFGQQPLQGSAPLSAPAVPAAPSIFGGSSLSSLYGAANTGADASTIDPQNRTDAGISTAARQSEMPIDQSDLMSSIRDKSINLYNLTLQEIIAAQLSILDRNIKQFRKEARTVLEQDMRLIKAKNNYVSILKNIEREEARMNELSEMMDYFEKYLDALPTGRATEMGGCCKEFEDVCDRFYKAVEEMKDDQDEVMSIINTNYELIESIDRKMDSLDALNLSDRGH